MRSPPRECGLRDFYTENLGVNAPKFPVCACLIQKVYQKIIITKTSMRPWTDDDGILHLGLYEFLLNENSLEL